MPFSSGQGLATSAWDLGVVQPRNKGLQFPVPHRNAFLGNLVPFSLIFVLCERDPLLFFQSAVVKPSKIKLFYLCILQTHKFKDVSGGGILGISVVWNGEGRVASRVGDAGHRVGQFPSVEASRDADMPFCFLPPDHSRSSKSSCWSSSDEKRGSSRSEHNASTSSKSLLPKESRLDTFWD